MEAPTASQAPSHTSRDLLLRWSNFIPSPVARFWIAVAIFLLASVLALWQAPRPDALRPPRLFASIGWWRYPLEWNAASRLPKIECGLNAIQAVPNTSSIWAVGNIGMVVTSNDGGRTWTKKSLENARAAPANSPTASPASSPSPSAKAFLHLPDLIPTVSAASLVEYKAQEPNSALPGLPPSPSPSIKPTKANPNSNGSRVTPSPTPLYVQTSIPFPARHKPSPRPSSTRANASPTAIPSPTLNPNATPTPAATEIEPLIAIYFGDGNRGNAIDNAGTHFMTTDGGESWSWSSILPPATKLPFSLVSLPASSTYPFLQYESSCTITAFSGHPEIPQITECNFIIAHGLKLPGSTTFEQTTFFDRLRPIYDGYPYNAFAAQFMADGEIGFVVGPKGNAYRTGDLGSHWKKLATQTLADLHGVFFLNENRGWVVANDGTIVTTSDGGSSWKLQPSGTQARLNSVNFLPDAQHGWIAGNDGLILSTDDGGTTWMHRTQGLEGNGGRYLRFPAPWYWLSLCLVGLLMWRRIEPPAAEPEESVADVLVSDRPLEEAADDVLAFNTIARGLSRFLRNENTLPPLTIAITGEWGTGKSSLMNLLRADLRSYKFHPVWFNAWHHQKEEHILASLLENIKLQAVPRWWTTRGLTFRARLLKIRGWRQWGPVVLLLFFIYVMLIYHFGHHGAEANFAGLIKNLLQPFDESGSSLAEKSNYLTLLPLIAGVVTFLGAIWRGITAFGVKPASLLAGVSRGVSIRGLEAQTSFRQKFAVEFNDVTRALGQRSMLIFIDDLDRCRPENVSETLEAVNFLTTSGECFVAIGMAREYVERCVGRAFKEVAEEMIDDVQDQRESPDAIAREKRIEFARQYLDKLINIEVPVPAPKQSQSLALLVASTRILGHTRATGRWQQFKLSLIDLIEHHWRFAPALLALAGLLFLGYYLALGLQDAGTVIQPHATVAATVAPTINTSPLTNANTSPTASPTTAPTPTPTPTSTPIPLNERAELVQGGRAILSRGFLPMIVLLALIWIGVAILTRRPGLVVKDSSRFVKALEIWHPLVFARQPTPRATKRFMNYVRYLAMRQRRQSDSQPPLKHFLERLRERITNVHQPPDPTALTDEVDQSIPDEVLVALAALQHLKPGCLDDPPGPTSSPDDVWPRPVIPGGPLAPLFDKAWREHEATFNNWGKLSQYRNRFLEMTAHVHVR